MHLKSNVVNPTIPSYIGRCIYVYIPFSKKIRDSYFLFSFFVVVSHLLVNNKLHTFKKKLETKSLMDDNDSMNILGSVILDAQVKGGRPYQEIYTIIMKQSCTVQFQLQYRPTRKTHCEAVHACNYTHNLK